MNGMGMLSCQSRPGTALSDLDYMDRFPSDRTERHSRSDNLAPPFPKGAVYFNHNTSFFDWAISILCVDCEQIKPFAGNIRCEFLRGDEIDLSGNLLYKGPLGQENPKAKAHEPHQDIHQSQDPNGIAPLLRDDGHAHAAH